MPALTNPRHERFAQELAKGKSQTEAYESAGYRPSRSAACRLSDDVSICERLAELQERAAVRSEITVASVTERLLRLAEIAEKTGVSTDDETGLATGSNAKHLSVARAAWMDAAKLNGLVVDKSQLDASVQLSEIRRTIVGP